MRRAEQKGRAALPSPEKEGNLAEVGETQSVAAQSWELEEDWSEAKTEGCRGPQTSRLLSLGNLWVT